MRNIIITEEQLKRIVGETAGEYLDTLDDIPDNGYGTEVFVNNIDKDAPNDVTITDNPASKRCYGNRMFRKAAHTGIVNEKELDDKKVNGFGMESDAFIQGAANNGGGKMIKNINNRINGGGGQRLNTTEVEISRMESDKKKNPANYVKNGGDTALKMLKSTASKQRNVAGAERSVDANIKAKTFNEIPDAKKGTGKGHHNTNNVYYY